MFKVFEWLEDCPVSPKLVSEVAYSKVHLRWQRSSLWINLMYVCVSVCVCGEIYYYVHTNTGIKIIRIFKVDAR